jgi:hypothetical protein
MTSDEYISHLTSLLEKSENDLKTAHEKVRLLQGISGSMKQLWYQSTELAELMLQEKQDEIEALRVEAVRFRQTFDVSVQQEGQVREAADEESAGEQ